MGVEPEPSNTVSNYGAECSSECVQSGLQQHPEQPRILFLEDNPQTIKLYIEAAQRFGFGADFAESTQRFVLLLERRKYYAVVADIMINKYENGKFAFRGFSAGLEVISAILEKRAELLKDTPIALFSERAYIDEQVGNIERHYNIDIHKFRKHDSDDYRNFLAWLERLHMQDHTDHDVANIRHIRLTLVSIFRSGVFWSAIGALTAIVSLLIAL